MNNFQGPTTIHYHVQTLHQVVGPNPSQLLAIPVMGFQPATVPVFSLQPAADARSRVRDMSILHFGVNGVEAVAASHHPFTRAHSLDVMDLMQNRLTDGEDLASRLFVPTLPPMHPQHFGLLGDVISLCVGVHTVKPSPMFILDMPRRLVAQSRLPRAVDMDIVPEVYLWQLVLDLHQQRQLAARYFFRMHPDGRKLLVQVFKRTKIPMVASWQLLWESVPVDILRGMVLFLEQLNEYEKVHHCQDWYSFHSDNRLDDLIQAVERNPDLTTFVTKSFQAAFHKKRRVYLEEQFLKDLLSEYHAVWDEPGPNKEDLLALLPVELKREGPYPYEPEGWVFLFSAADKALLGRVIIDEDFGHPFLKTEFLMMQDIFKQNKKFEQALLDRESDVEAQLMLEFQEVDPV